MRKPILAVMLAALAGPLVAQTSPPISNDLTEICQHQEMVIGVCQRASR